MTGTEAVLVAIRSAVAGFGRQAGPAGLAASAFEQVHVMPLTPDMAIPLTISDHTEPAFFMQGAARVIGRHHLRLKCPVAIGLGFPDELFEQGAANPLTVRRLANIDADLSDACGASRIGNRRERRPAEDGAL